MKEARFGKLLTPTRWALWTLSPAALAYFLAADAIGLVLGTLAVVLRWDRPGAVLIPLLICMLVSVEGARAVERVRKTGSLHKDMQHAWSLAAALVLPAGVAVVAAVGMYAWWRVRAGRCRIYAWVFSSAMIVLAVLAAGYVHTVAEAAIRASVVPSALAKPIAVLAAAMAFEAVDVLVCGAGIKLMEPGTSRQAAFGDRGTAATDAAALTFGGVLSIIALANPWAMLLALPAVVLLQRVLLVDQLAREARTDTKTGLATAGWWRERTATELDRARGRGAQLAVLVADLDHFKRINDVYGHLVGDEALRAVAGAVRAGVRGQDVAGRFGGEEFVVALPDTDTERAGLVAERLRARVAALAVAGRHDDPSALPVRGLTVSIGVATFPDHADDLDSLLRAADSALYAAKDAGRNQVSSPDDRPRRLRTV